MPNATLEQKTAAEVKVTVKLQPEDYQRPAKNELLKMARTANLKGFRKGKVPLAYMQKMYGKGVVVDTIGKAVDKAINELFEKENVDLFGQLTPVEEPDYNNLDVTTNEEITFVYEGGLMPKADSVDVKSLKKLSRFTVQLSDEESQEKLEGAAKQFVEYVERNDVETEEDFATLVLTDADLDEKFIANTPAEPAEGEQKESDPRQRYFLRPADLVKKAQKKLIGTKMGKTIDLSLEDLNEDIKSRFDKVIAEGEKATFTICKIDREQLPEMNAETFKKIFGDTTDIETEKDAKAEFARRYAENSQQNLDEFAIEQIIDALAESNELPMPQEAIKRRLEQARADELKKAADENRNPEYDHELTEADRHGLARRLQWIAFRQSLVEEHKIELDSEDIDAGLEKSYVAQLAGMGLDPEQFRDKFFDTFKKNFLENREQVMEMTDKLLNTKLLLHLEESGVIGKRKNVSEDEFQKIVSTYNESVTKHLDELRKQPI